ncbi:MAG TPA: hypothetical protein PKL04_06650 [Methanofastidiosum sp.]|nr:hypothetical protein [Methanofastidiosum sp.]
MLTRTTNTFKTGENVSINDVVNVRNLSNAHLSEYIYYECQFLNTTSFDLPAVFEEVRKQPLVMKPSDYKFAVVRIESSLANSWMFRTDEIVLKVGNYYAPDNLLVIKTVNFGPGVEFIYNIDFALKALNDTLVDTFNDLKAAYNAIYGPGAWEANINLAQKPFGYSYDHASRLFVIYADPLNETGLANAVTLLSINNMNDFFAGNAYVGFAPYSGEQTALEVFFDLGFGSSNLVTLNTGGDFIVNTASYDTTELWYSVKQIILGTNKLPVRLLEVGLTTEIGNPVKRAIITDFNYTLNNTTNSPGSRLQYIADNYRWIDLTGDNPLTQIQFELFYRNKDESLTKVLLKPDDSFSILCLFAKTVTN